MQSPEMKYCELCGYHVTADKACKHPGNGYCAIYQLQAKQDAKTYNMHPKTEVKDEKSQ